MFSEGLRPVSHHPMMQFRARRPDSYHRMNLFWRLGGLFLSSHDAVKGPRPHSPSCDGVVKAQGAAPACFSWAMRRRAAHERP
jgi:hypothetical protein